MDLLPHGDCQRPKTPLGGQNRPEGFDFLKKVFDKTSKKNRFELQPQSKKVIIFEASDLHISNSRTKTKGLDFQCVHKVNMNNMCNVHSPST